MKLAIDILTERRNDLRKGVTDATYNVNYHQTEARKIRANAAYYEKEACVKDTAAARACLKRNEL